MKGAPRLLSRRPRTAKQSLGLVLLLSTLVTPLCAAFETPPEEIERSAVVLEAGSIAHRQLIAISQDLVVRGEALKNAVAITGDARVYGHVQGDVIVLGGDAHLADSARVEGDVYVFGGRLHSAPGAEISGRSVAYPRAPRGWLVLMEGPALGLDPFSGTVLSAKLALAAAWLLASVLLVAAFARPLASTADAVQRDPFRSFFVGIVAVLSMVLTLLFFSAFASAVVGVPLLALVVLFALVLKLWGTVAVFQGLGAALFARVRRRTAWVGVQPMTAIAVGLLLLSVLKLLPWIGLVAWTTATFVGVGASLSTKFGRREPWLSFS